MESAFALPQAASKASEQETSNDANNEEFGESVLLVALLVVVGMSLLFPFIISVIVTATVLLLWISSATNDGLSLCWSVWV